MDDTTKVIITPSSAHIEGPALNIFDLIQLTFSSMYNFMQQTLEMAPEDQKMQTKEEIYDYVNISASNVLDLFAPEFEMNPDLTDEAIIKTQEELINARFDAMSDEDKAAAREMMSAYRNNLKQKIEDNKTATPNAEKQGREHLHVLKPGEVWDKDKLKPIEPLQLYDICPYFNKPDCEGKDCNYCQHAAEVIEERKATDEDNTAADEDDA